MASLKFIYRPSSRGDNYKGSISYRLIHQGKVKLQALPYKIYRHEWDKEKTHINIPIEKTARQEYLLEVSLQLEKIRTKLSEIIDILDLKGRYNLEDILEYYRFNDDMGGLQGYVEKLATRLSAVGQERTAGAYRTVVRGIVKYNHNKDIPLDHINTCLIKDFERDMKNRGKSLNTISYYMRNLRAIYNKAVIEKRIEAKPENPFSGVFTGFKKTRKRALVVDELQALYRLEFCHLLNGEMEDADKAKISKSLYFSWRLFFFAFYARGMSFVDMAYLRKENIKGGVIFYYRRKTGQSIEIKVTPILELLINSFSDDVKFSPYIFPIISDIEKPHRKQYESAMRLQNKRLRILAKMANIKGNLSTHVSRHSWATTAKEENLPIWVISEGLGHSSEKMTYTYLASFDRSVLDNANDIIAKALYPTRY